MISFVTRRLLQLPVALCLISLVVFSLIHITPGDPTHLMLGDFYTAADAERLRARLGLDRPLYEQYLVWLWGAVRLDFGTSFYTHQPIGEMIVERAPYTILLASTSMLLALLIAVPIGILSARYQNSLLDYAFMAGAVFGISVPNFALAVLMILVLAVWLKLLPISGAGNIFEDPAGSVRYYIMPTIALGFSRVALLSRMLRSSMLEVMHKDYVLAARAKGVREHVVVYRHVFRNALIPIITVTAIYFAGSLGGAVAIEFMFSLPGLGSLMLDALSWKDFPLVQGISLVTATVFLLANLAADIVYAYVDPRIRYFD
jgi:peptide/nickel transport system permease protein